jgi:hypothetical protein
MPFQLDIIEEKMGCAHCTTKFHSHFITICRKLMLKASLSAHRTASSELQTFQNQKETREKIQLPASFTYHVAFHASKKTQLGRLKDEQRSRSNKHHQEELPKKALLRPQRQIHQTFSITRIITNKQFSPANALGSLSWRSWQVGHQVRR